MRGNGWSVEQSEHSHLSIVCPLIWVWLLAPQNNYNNIKYHYDKYKDNEKVWNIARMTKMWHKDRKWANAVGKVLLIKWLNTQGGHISSIYRRHDTTKHDKAKHNKTSCACIHVHILSNSFPIPVLGMSKDKDKSTGQWRQSGDTCRQIQERLKSAARFSHVC